MKHEQFLKCHTYIIMAHNTGHKLNLKKNSIRIMLFIELWSISLLAGLKNKHISQEKTTERQNESIKKKKC